PGQKADGAAGATVIEAPTPWVWIIGRTQTNGPADYDAVRAVQDGFLATAIGERPGFEPDPDVDTTTEPLRLVDGMSAADFFAFAATPLAANPPHATDFSVLARIAALGIVPGEDFDPGNFTGSALSEIEAGVGDAKAEIAGSLPMLGREA